MVDVDPKSLKLHHFQLSGLRELFVDGSAGLIGEVTCAQTDTPNDNSGISYQSKCLWSIFAPFMRETINASSRHRHHPCQVERRLCSICYPTMYGPTPLYQRPKASKAQSHQFSSTWEIGTATQSATGFLFFQLENTAGGSWQKSTWRSAN